MIFLINLLCCFVMFYNKLNIDWKKIYSVVCGISFDDKILICLYCCKKIECFMNWNDFNN